MRYALFGAWLLLSIQTEVLLHFQCTDHWSLHMFEDASLARFTLDANPMDFSLRNIMNLGWTIHFVACYWFLHLASSRNGSNGFFFGRFGSSSNSRKQRQTRKTRVNRPAPCISNDKFERVCRALGPKLRTGTNTSCTAGSNEKDFWLSRMFFWQSRP